MSKLYMERIGLLDAMVDYLKSLPDDAPLPSLKETLRGAVEIIGQKTQQQIEDHVLKEYENG